MFKTSLHVESCRSCRTISDAVWRDLVIEIPTFQYNLDVVVISLGIYEYGIYVMN